MVESFAWSSCPKLDLLCVIKIDCLVAFKSTLNFVFSCQNFFGSWAPHGFLSFPFPSSSLCPSLRFPFPLWEVSSFVEEDALFGAAKSDFGQLGQISKVQWATSWFRIIKQLASFAPSNKSCSESPHWKYSSMHSYTPHSRCANQSDW